MAEKKKLIANGVASKDASLTMSKSIRPKEQASSNAVIADGSGVKSEKISPSLVDIGEVYFLILHFLSSGVCQRSCAQLKDELLEHKLLPRRYHGWYSRTRAQNGNLDTDAISLSQSYSDLVDRHSSIGKSHLIDLLNELLVKSRSVNLGSVDARYPTAADVPTLLGSGSASLLNAEQCGNEDHGSWWRSQYRWPHQHTSQVRAMFFREIGGGFSCHHRAPSIRAARNAIAKPSLLVDRMQIIKTFRGHRNAVYCAIFDQTGEYIITGSDDRLVKIWSTSTGFCLRSCRGHDGDITDLAVNCSNNLMASASNDFFIRVWSFPDGMPVSVLHGHTAAVTAIAFSPRQGCEYHLLSSSDDGTCRIWDARDSSVNARIYSPKPEPLANGSKGSASEKQNVQNRNRILCCAFNASGMIFVTGSADKLARVWDACKWNVAPHGGPNHELDTLRGHEDDVNYVQFSGCAAPTRPIAIDGIKDERILKYRNSWCAPESIVTCSRDGSAIIWVHSRKKHGKSIRYTKAYHLRVPPPPMPPQPPRGGGPRQRLLPTPRGVNMIVWSLDNCFVLAAIMDCRICVWNAVDGGLVHSLTGHTKSTFVLDVHPFNPRMAMSAGYDGRVIIWDIWEGQPIHVYETGEFNLVDGKFSPDGTSIVISDEVGQIYLIATGQGESQKEAKYDQFFLGDYRPLVRDVHGHVLDQEMQLPPHERNLQDLLCDANMIPYAEPYQSMYQQRRLGALGSRWQPPSMQLAVGGSDDLYIANDIVMGMMVPDAHVELTAAEQDGTRWVEQPQETEDVVDGEHDTGDDTGSDYTASINDTSDDDEREESHSCTEELMYSLEEEDYSDECENSRRASLRRSQRNKKKSKERTVTSSGRKVKRRLVEIEYDSSPVRRSKRQKRLKARVETSSSGTSDTEISKRPKRKAARNARFIFSQLSEADGDESPLESEGSQSESSENADPVSESQESTESTPNEISETKNDMSPEGDGASERSVSKKPMLAIKLQVPDQDSANHNASSENCNGKPSQPKIVADEISPKDAPGNNGPSSLPLISECNGETSEPVKDLKGHGEVDDTEATDGNAINVTMVDTIESTEVGAKQENFQSSSSKIENPSRSSNGKCLDMDICNERVNVDLNELQEESREEGEGIAREDSESQVEAGNCRDGHFFVQNHSNQDQEMNPSDEPKVDTAVVHSAVDSLESLPNTCTELDSTGACINQQPKKIFKVFQRQRLSSQGHAISNTLSRTSDIKVINQELGEVNQNLPIDDSRMQLSMDNMQYLERSYGFESANCFEASDPPDVATVQRNDSYTHQHLQEQCEKAHKFTLDVNETPIEEAQYESVEKMDTTCLEEHCTSGRLLGVQLPVAENGFDFSIVQDLPPDDEKAGVNDDDALSSGSDEHCHLDSPMASISLQPERNIESDGSYTGLSDSEKNEDGDEYFCRDIGSKLSSDGPSQSSNASSSDYRHFKSHVEVDNHNSFDEEMSSAKENNDIEMKIESTVTCIQEMTTLFPSRKGKGKRTKVHAGRPPGNFPRPKMLLTEAFHTRLISNSGETDIMARRFGSVEEIVRSYVPEKSGRDVRLEDEPHTKTTSVRSDLGTRKSIRQSCIKSDITLSNTAFEEGSGISKLTCRKIERSTEGNAGIEELKFVVRSRRSSFVNKDPHSESDEAKPSGALSDILSWKGKGGRSRKKLSSWLMLTQVEEGTRYIPQVGDDVAYVVQGHEEYLRTTHLDEKGPLKAMRVRLRSVEICRVNSIEYCQLPGFATVCCRLTLTFIDESSKALGRSLTILLPELTDFPDFIVEKARYDKAMQRNWTKRDKCKVWWRTEDGKGGSWWEGRVVAVEANSDEYPDSPWDRCTVQYKADSSGGHRHSPWELFDLHTNGSDAPHIDDVSKNKILMPLQEVEACADQDDAYGVKKLKQLVNRLDFLSRTLVPLSLDTLKARLANNYYRSLDAIKHDINIVVSNISNFSGSESELTRKIQNFSKKILEDT